jgi:hypothetical protein
VQRDAVVDDGRAEIEKYFDMSIVMSPPVTR